MLLSVVAVTDDVNDVSLAPKGSVSVIVVAMVPSVLSMTRFCTVKSPAEV